MHPSDPGQPRPKKRFPKWLTITLAVFGVLFVLGAIFGKAPQQDTTAAPAATTSAAPTTSTTPTPVAVTYTVATVSDAATFETLGSDGTRKTVHVLGVVTTGAGTDCFGAESLAWAGTKLTGTVIHLGAETAGGAAVALADGQDYATVAVQNGYLKAATSTLGVIETAARQAASGFWGPPCNGSVSLPAPPAPQQPTTVPPAPSTKAAPKPPARTTAKEPPPAPDPDTSSGVYYKNCAAARAAHAAPLHVGQPGYRPELDRDHDGVACDT